MATQQPVLLHLADLTGLPAKAGNSDAAVVCTVHTRSAAGRAANSMTLVHSDPGHDLYSFRTAAPGQLKAKAGTAS